MVAGQVPKERAHGAVVGAEPMEEDDGRPRPRLEVEGVDARGAHHLRPRETLGPGPRGEHPFDLQRQGDVASHSELARKERLPSRDGALDDGLEKLWLTVDRGVGSGPEETYPAVADRYVPLVGPVHVERHL